MLSETYVSHFKTSTKGHLISKQYSTFSYQIQGQSGKEAIGTVSLDTPEHAIDGSQTLLFSGLP